MKISFLKRLPFVLLTAVLISACPQPDNPTPKEEDPIIPGNEQTTAPVAAAGNNIASKTTEIQSIITFDLTSTVNGTWKVYSGASGTAVPAGISANFNAATKKLALIHNTNVPAADYWVTVTETGKTESERLKLTVRSPLLTDLLFTSDVILQENDDNVKPGETVGLFSNFGGDRPYVYSFVSGSNDNALFAINGETGVLAVKDNPLTEGYKTIKVKVTDNNSISVEKEFIIIVYPEGGVPGTEKNPFLVNDETDLRAVGRSGASPYTEWTLEKHYKQTADINLSGTGSWTRIGNGNSDPFTGSYDGSGHIITGLAIAGGTGGDLGMFSTVASSATVRNLSLINASVSGGGYLGLLAARNGGLIENCFASGTVNGTGYAVGGIVGSNDGAGNVKNCYTTGNVTSTSTNGSHAGGIVGVSTGKVTNCYATGIITGSSRNVGGVVGDNRVNASNNGTVSNCIALNQSVTMTTGTVSVGRVLGGNEFTQTSPAQSTLEYGNANDNLAWSGMELYRNSLSVSLSVSDTGLNHKNGKDIDTAEAKLKTTWENAGFLFTDSTPVAGPWKWDNSGLYMPSLNGEQILWHGLMSGKPYGLVLSAILNLQEDAANTQPGAIVGTFSARGGETPYTYSLETGTGDTDNNLFTISGSDLKVGSSPLAGRSFSIRVRVTGSNSAESWFEDIFTINVTEKISGDGSPGNPFRVTNTAALLAVGRGGPFPFEEWTMDKCYEQTVDIVLTGTDANWTRIGHTSPTTASPFTGTYNGNGHTISGLTINGGTSGDLAMFASIGSTGTVKNLGLINASVSGGNYLGILVARNSGTIENCYSAGTVSGTGYAIAGIVGSNGATVRNCYSTANAASTSGNGSHAGGVAGVSTGTITNCYATGIISGSSRNVGGVLGDNRFNAASNGTVTNCIALNQRVTMTTNTITVGRVLGGNEFTQTIPAQSTSEYGNASGNFAWNGIELRLNNELVTLSAGDTGTNHKNGGNLSTSEIKTKASWTGAGFLFTDSTPTAGPWTWDNSGVNMPSLNGENIPWPVFLNN